MVGFALAALAAVLSACRVDGTVLIDVGPDGSGEVSAEVVADAEAVERLGVPPESIRLDDLREAGWKVGEPKIDPNSGALTIRARRPFESSAELADVLGDIGRRPDGKAPFIADVSLSVDDGFARTDYGFKARLELDASVDELSDAALTEALGGLALGRTPEELAAMGLQENGIGTLKVRLRLPGKSVEQNGTKTGDTVEWKSTLGGSKATNKLMEATSVSQQRSVRLLQFGGVGLCVVAIGLVAVGFIRRH